MLVVILKYPFKTARLLLCIIVESKINVCVCSQPQDGLGKYDDDLPPAPQGSNIGRWSAVAPPTQLTWSCHVSWSTAGPARHDATNFSIFLPRSELQARTLSDLIRTAHDYPVKPLLPCSWYRASQPHQDQEFSFVWLNYVNAFRGWYRLCLFMTNFTSLTTSCQAFPRL